jgi:hypothetical protein
VTLSHPSVSAVTVDYATTDGTATSGSDFAAAGGTLTFAPGEVSAAIDVTVNGDTTFESDEDFSAVIANAANAVLGDDTGTGTITNDDRAPTSMSLRVRHTTGTVVVRGVIETAAAGMHVRVKLLRRSNGTLRKVASARVLVSKIRDRDHDGLADGVYRAVFDKPATHGRYRCTAAFVGDAVRAPASVTKRFRL